MKRFLCFFMVLYCVFNVSVIYAEECDSKYLKEVANAVYVDVEFDYEAANDGLFSDNIVTVYGLTDEIYAITNDGSVGFYFEDIFDGRVVKTIDKISISRLDIYSTKCPSMRLRTIDLSLKKYNSFYTTEACEGYQDKVDVCSEFYAEDISYDNLLLKIEEYKKSNSYVDVFDGEFNIENFFKENMLWLVILAMVIICSIIGFVVYIVKRNKLD